MNNEFKNFIVGGQSFLAKDCVDGVLINPKLPKNFDSTCNEYRCCFTSEVLEYAIHPDIKS